MAIWTLAGLIALYVSAPPYPKQTSADQQKLPILSGGNWGFYAAMVITAASP